MVDSVKITSLSGRGTLFLRRGDRSSYWLDEIDWGQASGQHNTYRYLDQVGASIVSTSIQPRALSLSGWVVETADGTLRERCDFLNAFFSPVEDYELLCGDKKIAFRPDCSIIYSREFKENNRKARRFLLQATCPFPLFSDSTDKAVPFESETKLFRFPADFGRTQPLVFAVVGSAYNTAINNQGGFAAGFVARIRFSGEVSGPCLTNLDTGEMIGVNHTFQNGEQLEIGTVSGAKHITLFSADGAKRDLIKHRDVRTSWFQLSPGVNHIAVSCTDTAQRDNMSVTLYYSPLYLEVE